MKRLEQIVFCKRHIHSVFYNEQLGFGILKSIPQILHYNIWAPGGPSLSPEVVPLLGSPL